MCSVAVFAQIQFALHQFALHIAKVALASSCSLPKLPSLVTLTMCPPGSVSDGVAPATDDGEKLVHCTSCKRQCKQTDCTLNRSGGMSAKGVPYADHYRCRVCNRGIVKMSNLFKKRADLREAWGTCRGKTNGTSCTETKTASVRSYK